MRTQSARLLVRSGPASPGPSMMASGNSFRREEDRPHKAYTAYETSGSVTIPELWDAAYDAARTGAVVEPDVENLWVLPTSKKQRGLFAGGPDRDRGIVNEQSAEFPRGPSFAWHLGPGFTQLAAAQGAIGQNPNPVRAAILDVGFDFSHKAMPQHLRLDLQRNFTGDGSPTAADPDRGGLLQNPGHGTATICLLAGKRLDGMALPTPSGGFLGAAPGIEVVPIRIATSVVLFRTSAFVDALEYILSLNADPHTAVDIVSMSMGGVASGAWAEVVNRAYDAGIFMVTAAGNNYGRPKSIVFPARFNRVLAACGIMADFTPYDLPLGKMSGNYGPSGKMKTALAAFTPNIPWAEIGGREDIVDWDGEGTSSATPQVAAAAALWLQKHKDKMANWAPWERIEMVRRALTEKADNRFPDGEKYLGRGVIKALDSLSVEATNAARAALQREAEDSGAFALFRALRGTILGAVAAESPLEASFNLELTQLMHRDPNLEEALPDPTDLRDAKQLQRFLDAAIESPYASSHLKQALRAGDTKPNGTSNTTGHGGGKQEFSPRCPKRRLRVFAFDPAAAVAAASADIASTTVSVPWEGLEPGPCGEYVEVIDHDPASGCFYAPVNLDDPFALAADGLAPAEGDPKFHQQMVYAVAMRTIDTFEKALGRRALWSPVMNGRREVEYVQKLRIYPHALRDRNAYYNPLKKALLFGYFPARPASLGTVNPGGMVFTCLSHDVVAHETSHALLDGMARGLTAPTNYDMLAFHEAFADIVAMFQHFSLPNILNRELAKSRGDLRTRSYLVEMAQEFGLGIGMHEALRSYLGTDPDPDAFAKTTEPHDRGAILVAAVFDAFVTIYEQRTADLRRIASGGTGILADGELHPDLVNRLAAEAAKVADQSLSMCIRAIDYCPPVDLTFGDFLRALVTVDTDLFPDDPWGYRPAIIEAFRKRGIYPQDVRTMSEDSLRWLPPATRVNEILKKSLANLLSRLQTAGDVVRRLSRQKEKPHDAGEIPVRQTMYLLLREERAQVHRLLENALEAMSDSDREVVLRELGLFDPNASRYGFEVHALSFADRPDDLGSSRRDVILWLTHAREIDGLEGGCTVIANCDTGEIRFLVRKSLASQSRQEEAAKFRAMGAGLGSAYLGNTPYAGPGTRFAMIHASADLEEGYA